MKKKIRVSNRDYDAALAIQVRAKYCPSMGVYPESYYDEIVDCIRGERGDFDVVIEHEIVDRIIPGDDLEYR